MNHFWAGFKKRASLSEEVSQAFLDEEGTKWRLKVMINE